jgi:hypothetical protein
VNPAAFFHYTQWAIEQMAAQGNWWTRDKRSVFRQLPSN